MQATIQVPKAFSVRDENEFFAFEHLMARLNPQLRVSQVGIGLHVNGGSHVFWGLVHLQGQKVAKAQMDEALREAGFDVTKCASQLNYASVVEQAKGDGKPLPAKR
jgi:hypothetical protein